MTSGRWKRPCILISLIVFFPLPLRMHLCMLQVWDDLSPGGTTCLFNLHNPCMFTQIDIVPKLAFNSLAHKNPVSQTYTPGVRHKIHNNKSLPNNHFVSSLELWLICYLLPRALGKTKTAAARTLERAYCSCCPQVQRCLAGTNHHSSARETTARQTP